MAGICLVPEPADTYWRAKQSSCSREEQLPWLRTSRTALEQEKRKDCRRSSTYPGQLNPHCKMKRAKLTPKAKLAPISRGPVWPIKVRFGLFEPKRAGQVPFRPLQNLNWPLWILLWNFFSIWPFQEPSRIDQFGPNEVQFLKKKENIKLIFFFRPYFAPTRCNFWKKKKI